MAARRKGFLVLLVLVLVAALAPVAHGDGDRPMLARVFPDSRADAALLMSHYDETHNHTADSIELLLWPGDRAELEALGFEYEIVTEDLLAQDLAQPTAAAAPIRMPGPDRDDYRRLADYNTEMQELAKKNPDLVKVFEMPRPSLEGRPVVGVEIAAGVKKEDGRPIFYMDGVHHAREWPASEYTMLFIHYLVEGYGKDPRITSLLKKARVIAVPIVNVDGFDYSREAVLSYNDPLRNATRNMSSGNGFEGYWRKNRRSLTGVTVPAAQRNPDAYGVDPNRNYSYLWGDNQGGSSGVILDQTYRGDAPFSEPETQNVRDLVLSRSVTGVITNHTYQASVLRAGGGLAPEDPILVRIGDKMAKLLGYKNAPSVGYPTTGTTDDWAYAVKAILGFTIEHGLLGFHPPYADEVGKFWKQHMAAFMVMLEASADPRYHSVLKGKIAGGAAKLSLTKTVETPLSEGNPTGAASVTEKVDMKLTTDADGSFVWHVTPSFRPFEKKDEVYKLTISSGGKKKTITIDIDRGQTLDLGTIRL